MEVLAFKYVWSAVVYSIVGLAILGVSFFVFDKVTPGNLWKEVVEEKNVALAITVAAWTLAIAHIIASSLHG